MTVLFIVHSTGYITVWVTLGQGRGPEMGLNRERSSFAEGTLQSVYPRMARSLSRPYFRSLDRGFELLRRSKRHLLVGLLSEWSRRLPDCALCAHALRAGFITAAYDQGVRDEDIIRHTRHRDVRTMRGYVQRAGLLDL